VPTPPRPPRRRRIIDYPRYRRRGWRRWVPSWKLAAGLIGLGLNRIGRVVALPDTAATRGMIAKVKHLVRVVEEN